MIAPTTHADGGSTARPAPCLLDRLRQRLLERGHGEDVAGNHVAWCRRFILFHRKRHPRDMGVAEVSQFLAHVAKVEVEPLRAIAAARSALEFLYRAVLGIDLGELPWPKPPKLLDQVRHLARLRHYSPRTEGCYVARIENSGTFQSCSVQMLLCPEIGAPMLQRDGFGGGWLAAEEEGRGVV